MPNGFTAPHLRQTSPPVGLPRLGTGRGNQLLSGAGSGRPRGNDGKQGDEGHGLGRRRTPSVRARRQGQCPRSRVPESGADGASPQGNRDPSPVPAREKPSEPPRRREVCGGGHICEIPRTRPRIRQRGRWGVSESAGRPFLPRVGGRSGADRARGVRSPAAPGVRPLPP